MKSSRQIKLIRSIDVLPGGCQISQRKTVLVSQLTMASSGASSGTGTSPAVTTASGAPGTPGHQPAPAALRVAPATQLVSAAAAQHNKTIEMIGEEFVPRLKTEPDPEPGAADPIGVDPVAVTRPSVVMSVSQLSQVPAAVAEQPNLVYCNLNELEFGGEAAAGSATSGHGLGDVVVSSAGGGQQQILQIVQAVPGLQLASADKGPYSSVSNILLQVIIIRKMSPSVFVIKR